MTKEFNKITKAVIALAGNATRFLPATKNQPKQMLPIVNKPIIQYLVEECVNAGITDIILVTQVGQSAMEDYFDNNIGLEYILGEKGKKAHLKIIKDIPKLANFIYIRQKKNLPYGNGTPLLVVKNLIDDNEAFAYLFGDDLVKSKTPGIKQLIDSYYKYKPAAVLGVQKTPWEEVHKYATVKYKNIKKDFNIEEIVEKAPKEKAPSNMAQFGRFIFTYSVINEAEKTPLGLGQELWVADILNRLAQKGKRVVAQPIEGRWITTGDPLNYMKASVEYTLDRKDIGNDFKKYLKNLKLND